MAAAVGGVELVAAPVVDGDGGSCQVAGRSGLTFSHCW